MIERLEDPAAARAWCRRATASGTLGFVPTMGALHAGHLELVRRAVAENDRACVSVFVNPLQFDEARDFERYPRDLEGDARALEAAGCQMVFTGTLAGFFPDQVGADGRLDPAALRAPGPAAAGLEGEFRPGHFEGVATIVARLFDVTEPTRAYFGEKDFQQLLVVRDLARARGGPEIVACPIVREPSGLARSSRNELLDPERRAAAASIARGLRAARAAFQEGERNPGRLLAAARVPVERAGLEVEYAALRDPLAWSDADPEVAPENAVLLVAARAGDVRLIDNARLDR